MTITSYSTSGEQRHLVPNPSLTGMQDPTSGCSVADPVLGRGNLCGASNFSLRFPNAHTAAGPAHVRPTVQQSRTPSPGQASRGATYGVLGHSPVRTKHNLQLTTRWLAMSFRCVCLRNSTVNGWSTDTTVGSLQSIFTPGLLPGPPVTPTVRAQNLAKVRKRVGILCGGLASAEEGCSEAFTS